MDTDTIGLRLADIDWTFSSRTKGDPVENIHPYPAKFISELPRTLIRELLIPPGTAVFDPFCGSGSTLVEAQREGIPSVGIDLNPIACLISRVKTQPLPIGFQRASVEVASNATHNRDPERWEIPNLDHWFKPDVQEAVAALLQEIRRLGDHDSLLVDALRLALSSILVRVSNQDSDTRYAAVEKNVSRADVFSYFQAACSKLSRALSQRTWELVPSKVVEKDILKARQEDIGQSVGLVITSPPYPNAYEYWLYHKYRMWWLGYDPLSVKQQEIGARAHFFKRDPHTVDHFWNQMRGTFSLIDSTLVDGGFVCIVVGRSKINGAIVDNAGIVQEVAREYGMAPITRLERTIAAQRKSFNLSHANIKTESIVVLRKGRLGID